MGIKFDGSQIIFGKYWQIAVRLLHAYMIREQEVLVNFNLVVVKADCHVISDFPAKLSGYAVCVFYTATPATNQLPHGLLLYHITPHT